jgi:radical SAM superfamily enzyme YgiQ (UPF0313 family)
MLDILMLSVPRIAPVRPQAAMGVLKALCVQENKTSNTLDFNKEFFLELAKKYPAECKEIDDYFVAVNSKLSEKVAEVYNNWLNNCIGQVLNHPAKFLVVSVFSWQSQRFVKDFLKKIRPQFTGEIIIGGQGLVQSQNMSSHWSPRASYAEALLSEGLIDWFMKGESEETFPRFLRGERDIPGLNRNDTVTLADANLIPISNFDDFALATYQNGFDGGVLPIESCRGCVRSCIFCEMSSSHGAYRRKDGSQLGKELIYYYEKYNVKHYYFHDDLINGGLDDFDAFLNTLLDYYKKHNLPDRYFTFSGYWIVRSRKQFNESDYEKLYRAGGNTLVTGVETGSDRLRKVMKKGFINKDLEFTLEQISKWRMKFYFMLISGLPGETTDDFNETLKSLTRWQKFVATGAIIGINLGTTATLEPGTEIYNNFEKYNLVGLKGNRPQGINWMSLETPELDYKERVRRRVILQEHVVKLGYPLWKGDDHLKIILDQYKQNIELWEG